MSEPTEPVPPATEIPPAPPGRGVFVRDTATIAFGQYLARALVLARSWGAAVALGPQGFGVWNALNLIYDYGYYAPVGTLQGLDLRLPAAVALGDSAGARRLMAGAWSIVIAGGVAVAVSVLASFAWAPRTEIASDPRLALLMVAATVLQLAYQYFATTLRAHGRFGAVSAGQSLQAVLGAGIGFALVWRYGLWGLLGGWIAGTCVALARMRLACPEAPLVPAAPRAGLGLTRLGFPIFAFYGVSLVLRSVDRLALVRYGTAHALGLYAVGLVAAGLVLSVPEPAAFVLFPRIAAAYHGAMDRERAKTDVRRAQRGLAILMPLAVGLAMVWAGPIVAAALPAYRDAVPALRVLATGALALSAATIPSYFLLACGRQHALLGLGVFAALANAALVFGIAARNPEPVAVALASTAGYVLFALLILACASYELCAGARARAAFVLASLGPAAYGAALAFAAIRFTPGTGFLAALGASVAFAAGYGPLAYVMARGLRMRTVLRDSIRQ